MKKPSPASADSDWLETFLARLAPPHTERTPFRPQLSPSEQAAERTARVARELTEAESETRQAAMARLRAARLAKDAPGTKS